MDEKILVITMVCGSPKRHMDKQVYSMSVVFYPRMRGGMGVIMKKNLRTSVLEQSYLALVSHYPLLFVILSSYFYPFIKKYTSLVLEGMWGS